MTRSHQKRGWGQPLVAALHLEDAPPGVSFGDRTWTFSTPKYFVFCNKRALEIVVAGGPMREVLIVRNAPTPEDAAAIFFDLCHAALLDALPSE